MTAVLVTIDDLTFNTGTRDTDGVEWNLDITAGWDAPQVDQSTLARIRPGSSVVSRLRHRTIVCEGVVVAATDEAHWRAYRRLQTLVPVAGAGVRFTVHEPIGARFCDVVSGPGSPRIRTHDGRVFEFQLVLIADDPTQHEETP